MLFNFITFVKYDVIEIGDFNELFFFLWPMPTFLFSPWSFSNFISFFNGETIDPFVSDKADERVITALTVEPRFLRPAII